MNLQEILEQNDLVMSINNNFNVLSFYIPEIECMVEFNQKQPQHQHDLWNHTLLSLFRAEENDYTDFDVRLALLLLLKDLLDIIIMFRELLLRWLMLF